MTQVLTHSMAAPCSLYHSSCFLLLLGRIASCPLSFGFVEDFFPASMADIETSSPFAACCLLCTTFPVSCNSKPCP